MTHQRLKDFWISKIKTLITSFKLDPISLDAGADWVEKMNDVEQWRDIDAFAKNIFKDVHVKSGKAVPKFFTEGERYDKLLDKCFTDLDLKFADLVNVFKAKIGVDPTDKKWATDAKGNNILVNGHKIPNWKYLIFRRIPKDLTCLLYESSLYKEIIDNTNGLPNLILRNLKAPHRPNAFGYDWTYKVNTITLQEYKNSKKIITNAETHLGLKPGDLATITTNPAYKLNGKTLVELLTPHTCSTCTLTHCSHSDYDTIKQERNNLKQRQVNYSTEKQRAIKDKEKEIVDKIITDLGLTPEREREREREH